MRGCEKKKKYIYTYTQDYEKNYNINIKQIVDMMRWQTIELKNKFLRLSRRFSFELEISMFEGAIWNSRCKIFSFQFEKGRNVRGKWETCIYIFIYIYIPRKWKFEDIRRTERLVVWFLYIIQCLKFQCFSVKGTRRIFNFVKWRLHTTLKIGNSQFNKASIYVRPV